VGGHTHGTIGVFRDTFFDTSSATRSNPDDMHRHTGTMKSLLIVLAVVALILLIIGIAVETLKFLLYIGLVVLIASAALYAVQRLRSSARR
jgi:uncharacterized membrane protein YdbT with pleckstrin-like domain